jgi:hypothetical protein
VIALPKDYPLAVKDSVALAELEQEVFILPSDSAIEVLHHTVMTECADAGFQPKSKTFGELHAIHLAV